MGGVLGASSGNGRRGPVAGPRTTSGALEPNPLAAVVTPLALGRVAPRKGAPPANGGAALAIGAYCRTRFRGTGEDRRLLEVGLLSALCFHLLLLHLALPEVDLRVLAARERPGIRLGRLAHMAPLFTGRSLVLGTEAHPPAVLRRVMPVPLARGGQPTAEVVGIDVGVSAAGRVEWAAVVRSTGNSELDRAAVEAVAQWRFAPARSAQGEAMAAVVSLRIPLVGDAAR